MEIPSHSDPVWDSIPQEANSSELLSSLRTPMVMPRRVEWDEFIDEWNWEQGDHVAIIGPVKSGKSTLIRSLLKERDWCIVLGSKKKDSTYDRFIKDGYQRFTKWPPPKPKERHAQSQHLLQWPKIKTMEELKKIGPLFHRTLEEVFIDEGWTIGLDDLYYLAKVLNDPKGGAPLAADISALNYQVRSMGVTLVSAMQRPSWVPIGCWDQSSYAFISQLANYDDVATLRGLAKVSPRELQQWITGLERYEWLYLPVRGSNPLIVKPPE